MKKEKFKFDEEELRRLIKKHVTNTSSQKGKEILDNFKSYIPKFKKIIPKSLCAFAIFGFILITFFRILSAVSVSQRLEESIAYW